MSDNDQGPLMCGSIAAALFSATVFTAARLYCSAVVLRHVRREDVIILLSLIFLWAASILTVFSVVSGMGKHIDTLTVEQRSGAKFYYLVSIWPMLLAITVPKVAVAGLIIRIFTPDIWTKTIMTVVACVGVANYFVISALSIFMCVPLAAAWDPRVQPVRCVSAKTYLYLCYITSTYSASVDFYLAIYPALVFRKMGFSIIKKISLSVVLGLGVGVTAFACLKISSLHALSNEDFTWTTPRLTIWTIVEATVTIVAACIPVLHPLYDRARAGLRKIFPSLQGRHPHHEREGSTIDGRRHGVRHADPDSPGFWSRKLRAIAAAESWWSTTAGRTASRGQRSGLVATAQRTEDRTARRFSGTGAVVVVHDEGGGTERQGTALDERSREPTVSVGRVTELELPDLERGSGRIGGYDPGPTSRSEHATVLGQK